PTPALPGHPRAILMPHIGASTEAAEENCATMAVDQLRDCLEHGNIRNSANFPNINAERRGGKRIAAINQHVPGMLGKLLSMLAERDINVHDMLNKSRGEVAYNLIDVEGDCPEDLLAEIRAIAHVTKAWLV